MAEMLDSDESMRIILLIVVTILFVSFAIKPGQGNNEQGNNGQGNNGQGNNGQGNNGP